MGREDQIINERLKKLKELQEQGIETYPSKVDKTQTCLECLNSKIGTTIKTAGRVMTKRDFGQIGFANLKDGTGEIQLVFQTGETKEEVKQFMKKYIDSGDFIQVDGKVFKTKTDQISILVEDIKLITKSILPLPEKFHGIQDEEEKLRKRYLDILMNPEVKEMFIKKQKFWNIIRTLLIEKGFLEVETPILETSAGGATATPFKTHHNALDTDVYLRISMGELWQKKLMVAGLDKTFEIGRQFRNEGMDAEHLQDYTQMEFYWAYADYEQGMKFVEEMYKYIIEETFNTLKFKIRGFDVDFSGKWEKYDYVSTIAKYTKVNILEASLSEMEKALQKLKIDYDKNGFNITRAIDNLWKYCRKNISGPGFLINVPVTMEPLAKRMESHNDLVQRFQVIIGGSENGKGFSELNDPIDQAERFTEQQKLRDKGDLEAQMYDKDFVEALEHGMPPTCGFGVSERLFAFLMDKPARECQIFPLMRPKFEDKEAGSKNTDNL